MARVFSVTDRVCEGCGKHIAKYTAYGLCNPCYKRLIWRPRGGEAVEREREAHRAWKAAHAGTCEKCGAPTTGGVSGHGQGRWCRPCGLEVAGQMAAVRQKDKFEARRQRIVTLWNEGWTMSQIAADLGCATNAMRPTMVKLRKQGYDLPYRRTPEQRARIKAGVRKAAA